MQKVNDPKLDVLLNFAGVEDLFASTDNITDEMWNRNMAVNLTASIRLRREALQVMKMQKDGAIVDV